MNKLIESYSWAHIGEWLSVLSPRILAALLVFIASWLVYKLTTWPIRKAMLKAKLNIVFVDILVYKIYKGVFVLIAVLLAAGQLGVNVGATLAGLGVVGIALGLAAQDSLGNVIAGFMIFWDKPFEVGHWIEVSKHYGKVKEITLRSTRIRTRDNTFVVIPNQAIINEVLENHSKQGAVRVQLKLSIAYQASVKKARETLLKVVDASDDLRHDLGTEVVLTELADSGVNLQVNVWIDNPQDDQRVKYHLLELCKEALQKDGIEIPYPHMEVIMKK